MKTDMTRSVGFDELYESGGGEQMPNPFVAVSRSFVAIVIEPSEAAASTVDFVLHKLTQEQSGTFWAPRGPMSVSLHAAILFER